MVSSTRIAIFAVVVLCSIAPNLAFIEGCVNTTITNDTNGREICGSCEAGYFRGQGGFYCNLCPSGCASCDGFGLCLSCNGGTYLVNGLCQSCGIACARCNGAVCGTCLFGYSLIENNCVRCIDNCANCDANGVCVGCRDGYELRDFNRANQRCELSDNDRIGKALITLIVFGLVCCLPMVVCCFCFFRLGARAVNGPAGSASSGYAYNPNPFVNMNNQPVNTGYGAGYY